MIARDSSVDHRVFCVGVVDFISSFARRRRDSDYTLQLGVTWAGDVGHADATGEKQAYVKFTRGHDPA